MNYIDFLINGQVCLWAIFCPINYLSTIMLIYNTLSFLSTEQLNEIVSFKYFSDFFYSLHFHLNFRILFQFLQNNQLKLDFLKFKLRYKIGNYIIYLKISNFNIFIYAQTCYQSQIKMQAVSRFQKVPHNSYSSITPEVTISISITT